MNLLQWRRFSSSGEGTVIAGTPTVGAGQAGIDAVFAGVAASAGAARQDGTVGAGRELTALASTGRVQTVRASTGQAQTVQASTGQAQIVRAPTGRVQTVPGAAVAVAAAVVVAAAPGAERPGFAITRHPQPLIVTRS